MLKKIKFIFSTLHHIPYFYGMLFFVFLLIFIVYDTLSHKRDVYIAVGSDTGAYYEYALQYKELLKKYEVDLHLIQTKGAVEAQEELEHNNSITFGFTQGGVEKIEYKDIYALANVAHEPIWVFYKDDKIKKFDDLKGKIVNICQKGTGTEPVARELLVELLEMDEKNIRTYKAEDAYKRLLRGEIDAMFYIIAKSSSALQKILNTKEIHIMNFPNSNSIKKFFIKQDMNISGNRYFSTVVLQKHSLDYIHKLPKNDKELMVKRTILITKGASDGMVRLLLKVAHKIHSKVAFFHNEGHFLNTHALRFSQHPASKYYFENPEHHYERNILLNNEMTCERYWLAQSLKKVEDFVLIFIVLLGLIGFFIEVVYPIVQIFTRRKVNRWYRKVNRIDTKIEVCSLEELKVKKIELESTLREMRDTDNIASVHLEAYYSVQQQIKTILENLESMIKQKRLKRLKRLRILKRFKRKYIRQGLYCCAYL